MELREHKRVFTRKISLPKEIKTSTHSGFNTRNFTINREKNLCVTTYTQRVPLLEFLSEPKYPAVNPSIYSALSLDQGLFFYMAMSFGLKNAPATFQQMINTVFINQIGRNVEAYIDDLIVKSKLQADHLVDLRKTFTTLRRHQVMLNPKKCVFGVESGKFLGFLIDQKGIEANLEKIQAVINMKSPRTVKEVQKLTGCLTAWGRFLSRSGDKCLYFFQAIRKKTTFEWGDDAEATFQKLKEHLHSLPRVVSPLPKEMLYMYLAASDHALSAVLLAERDSVHLPVYFTSHIL